MPGSARLVASRTSPRDIKMRELYVQLGGEPLDRTLHWDQQCTWELAPGTYELVVHNRLYRKVLSITLEENRETTVLVANVATGCFAVLFLIAGMGPYRVEVKVI
jgi:hypothetical protein